jgi:hypothetical protein
MQIRVDQCLSVVKSLLLPRMDAARRSRNQIGVGVGIGIGIENTFDVPQQMGRRDMRQDSIPIPIPIPTPTPVIL